MARPRSWLLTLALALTLVALGLGLTLQSQPRVAGIERISAADVERALLIVKGHDPRRLFAGLVHRLQLSPHEAGLLLNQAAARSGAGRWRVALQPGTARLEGSIEWPIGPWRRWLNIDLLWRQGDALPVLDAARVGNVPLPPTLVRWCLQRAAARQGVARYAALADAVVRRVQLLPGRMVLSYAWSPDATSRLLAAVFAPDERDRLRVYAEQLALATAGLAPKAAVSLSELLPPLFDRARQRTLEGRPAALENRAALMVLGLVANGIPLAEMLSQRGPERLVGRADIERRHPFQLTLAGRTDFPQHFLVSATLAAENGAPLADTIGLFKELADARRGSGFSFNDIAANRAGARFGALAVQAPTQLQERLAGGVLERDFMPEVADLPEFMRDAEFRQRFGGPGLPAYERMVADIDRRVDATALYR